MRPALKSLTLEPKLEAVVARLCEKLGPLYTTKAVKLPYLVDVVAQHALGRRVTGGTHETWRFGVVTREVYRFAKHGSHEIGIFTVEEEPFTEGTLLKCKGLPRAELTADEREIVDFVAEEYGSLDTNTLGEMTKALNTEIPPEEWGSNHAARVDEDAYVRLGSGWQEFARRLPYLDLDDRSLWSEPIEDDPVAHFKRRLAASS